MIGILGNTLTKTNIQGSVLRSVRNSDTGKRPRAAVSWSSGKDSAYALHKVLKSGDYEVVALLTTVTDAFDRVSMHGVREELLRKQAESVGIPITKVLIPPNSTNKIYEEKMSEAIEVLKNMGVEYMIFGDLFLEDIRSYRESRMDGTGIEPVFPLWGIDTGRLAREMIETGLEARVVCLNPEKLDRKFGGSSFDMDFIDSLPESVDPCGENGEFHTFVTGAPFFNRNLRVETGISVERDGFYFTDLYMP